LNDIGTGALTERIDLVKPSLPGEVSLSKLSRAAATAESNR
jgi:hypothetical protein